MGGRLRRIIARSLPTPFRPREQSGVDTLDGMRLFVRVVERRSFTAAAADMGVPRSTATTAIRRLEARLGVQLLRRSTRHVAPTPEGEAYHARCVAILEDVEDAEASVSAMEVRGVLRIDVNGYMARSVIVPKLPAFLDRHPGLDLHIGEGDRLVDLLREGVDCVVRGGTVADDGLVVRRLGEAPETTCASPAYLDRHGRPATPDDLEGHRMVGFFSSRTGQVLPLEFTEEDGRVREVMLPARVTANTAETLAALAREGFGLVQAPRARFLDDFAQGRLEEVLTAHPPTPIPISILYPPGRHLPPRVRVFIDWLVSILGPNLRAL